MGHTRYRAKRNYKTPPNEPAGKVPRIYRLNATLVARLERLCEDAGFFPSHLVETILQDGLRRVERGELVIIKRPVMFELVAEQRENEARTE